jgi:hypothetical protein
MADRKLSSVPWIGVAVLAVLIGGYVEAYYGTLIVYHGLGDEAAAAYSLVENEINPDVSTEDSGIGRFFAPMHWLDRRIRPHVWELTP